MRLIFVPGWGFGPDFFAPLMAELPEHDCVALGAQETVDKPVVAVGHSLGFLWLLKQRPFAVQALISLNGFTRFAQGEDWPDGVPARVLQRMQAGFSRAPEEVWSDFQTRCGLPPEAHAPLGDTAHMQEGLGWLAEWDGRTLLPDVPVLALAGARDEIVPPALSAASFGASLRWHPQGTHALPVQDPAWCVREVRDFLQCLNTRT